MFSEFSCSLCSLLQADESRREEAHSTPGVERAVVLYVLFCRRMKADVKKHIRLPEKSEQLFFMFFVAGG
jgi:hypothetical protein